MASLKDIRKRIQSVTSTRQITRAMKMVAAAKLRRSQEAILNARPYAYRLYAILVSLSKRRDLNHALLEVREEKRVRLVILGGDRGLCGAFNSNVFREANRFIKEQTAKGVAVTLDCVGRKAYDTYKRSERFNSYHQGLLAHADYREVAGVADAVLSDYESGNYDAVYLAYNEFKSAIAQRVTVERLIPISTDVPEGVAGILSLSDPDRFNNYIFEPSQQQILDAVVPRHFKTQLYRAVLESVASEHGARMAAMENASKNASEMIGKLTLQYNKARQAAITKELMEIVGGVEAMR